MTRREYAEQAVGAILDALVSRYGAEKVILFGSMAGGHITDLSDVDLVVIKRTALPFFDRLREVANICQWHCAMDILVYTPEEFQEMSRTNTFLREEVVRKGRVLYDRAA